MTQEIPTQARVETKEFRKNYKANERRAEAAYQEMYDLFGEVFGVAAFGSARLTPKDRAFLDARRLAQMISESGGVVVTGGGPGIMEASNEGARAGETILRERDGITGRSDLLSVGYTLPFGREPPNPALTFQRFMPDFSHRVAGFTGCTSGTVAHDGAHGTHLEGDIVEERIGEIHGIKRTRENQIQRDIDHFLVFVGEPFEYRKTRAAQLKKLGVLSDAECHAKYVDIGFQENSGFNQEITSASAIIQQAQREWVDVRKKSRSQVQTLVRIP